MRPLTPRFSYRVLSALARRMAKVATLLTLTTIALIPSAHAAQWMDVATISSTLTNTAGRLCVGGGRTDIGCPANSPLLDSAAGLLTVPGDLRVIGNLYVSGSQQFDGVTFSNGGVSATGTVTATSFTGSGAGLSGIPASAVVGLSTDRIVSTSANVVAGNGGTISFTTGGVSGTAYIDTTGRFVAAGVSTTGPISSTNGYFSGNVGIGTTAPSSPLHVASTSANLLKLQRISGQINTWSFNITGNTGSGITSGSMVLEPSTDAQLAIRNQANQFIWAINTPNGNMYLPQGSLGLGISITTIPSTSLHVSGTLRIANGGETCDTNRLGAIRYTAGSFDICKNTISGWEPLATATSSTTPSINTGLSGSIVFRDQSGYLKAYNSFSISSTTGSVGIGAGAPAGLGASGLYISGSLQTNDELTVKGIANLNKGILFNEGNAATANLMYLGSNAIGPVNASMGMFAAGVGSSNANHGPYFVVRGNTFNYLNEQRGAMLFTAGNPTTPIGTDGSIQFWTGPELRRLIIDKDGKVGIGMVAPSTTLHVSGTLRISNGGETCDTNRIGAIKYQSSAFYVCQNTANGWEALATTGENSLADRITSNSQAGVIANATGYISLTTGGVTGTAYFAPNGRLVTTEISTTSTISATDGYFTGLRVGSPNNITNAITPFQSYANISGNYSGIGGMELRNTNNGINADFRFVVSDNLGTSGNYLAFSMPSSNNNNTLFSNTRQNLAAIFTGSGLGYSGNGRDLALGTVNAGSLIFGTTNAERMRIVSNGLVGIGTRAPSTTLHVSGTLRIADGAEACDANRTGAIRYNSGQFYVCRNGTTWETMVAGASGTADTDRITSGTTNVTTNNNTSISFTTAGVERMVVGTNGNVGIGTNAPATALDTSGTLTVRNHINLLTIAPFAASSGTDITTNGTMQFLTGPGIRRMVMSRTNGIMLGDSLPSNNYPSTTLHISGTLRLSDGGETCDANRTGAIRYASGQFYVCRNGTTWETMVAGASGTADTDRITSGTNAMVINSGTNGYVSVTSLGDTKITLLGSATGATSLELGQGRTGDGYSYIDLTGDTTYQDYGLRLIRYNAGANTGSYLKHRGTGNLSIETEEAAPIVFRASSTEAMRIVSTGYVGIGTSTPGTNLVVSGTTWMGDEVGNGNAYSAGRLNVYKNDGNYGWPATSGSIDNTVMTRVWGGASTLDTGLDSSGIIWLQSRLATNLANNSPLVLQPNGGNLGIGMRSYPSTTLHISGTIRIANGGEACDANRTGAIRYNGGEFSFCRNGTTWETLDSIANGAAAAADRITSGTTQMIVYNNTSATIATAGVERLVIGTGGQIGIAQQPEAAYSLAVSGSTKIRGTLDLNSATNNNLFIGSYAGDSNTGTDNIAIGLGAGEYNQGGFSNFFGQFAGQLNTGNNVFALGHSAARNNTGPDSLAIGNSAAVSNTGTNLLAIGYMAGANNQGANVTAIGSEVASMNTGNNLVAMGYEAATNNTGDYVLALGSENAANANTGSYVVALGTSAAQYNTGGFVIAIGDNTLPNNQISGTVAIGSGALNTNTSGLANTAVGYSALGSNETGSYNTALGFNSGSGATGSFTGNTFLGAYTGTAVTTGSSNTIVGANSGMGLTTGSNNILIGASLSVASNTGSNQLNIGNAIFGNTGSGLGYANLIGINVPSPTYNLDVSGTVRATRFIGDGSLLTNISASSISGLSSDRIISGTTNVIANNNASISFTSAGIERMAISNNGVGIGQTPSIGVALAVSGNVSVIGRIGALASGTNVFVGSSAGSANTGTFNTGFGHTTLGSNSGNYNVGVGMYTLQNNTAANSVAVGYVAGQANSGNNLTALGYVAGQNNTAANVTVIGNASGQGNAGAGLTAVGSSSGLSNNAINATLIGVSAGQTNTGANATAVGSTTGQTNTGAGLTAVGYGAAFSNSGLNVTSIGGLSGQINSGNYLTSLGFQAAQYNTTGINNTALGTYAMNYSTTGSNNAIVGFQAAYGASNTTVFSRNSVFGSYAGTALTTGSSNTLLGYLSGGGITTGNDNVVIGAQTTPYSNTGSYQLNIANAIWGNIGSGTGHANKIGINVTSPTANLEVSGTISATNIAASSFVLQSISGSAGVSMSSGGDNLGNHTATQNLAMGGFSITGASNISASGNVSVTGNVSANKFIGDGSLLTNISASAINGLSADRLTSGSLAVTANSTTSMVSFSTAGTTWGYLGSLASYLPNFASNAISTTNISLTTINGLPYGGTALGDRITSGTTSVIAQQNGAVTISATALHIGSYDEYGDIDSLYIGLKTGIIPTSYTTAVGNEAAMSNTGTGVTAFGALAGKSNSGETVTFMGYAAGHNNTNNNVVAIGYTAGYDNTGSSLVALGYSAAAANTGNYTIAIGQSSAESNTGANSIFIGRDSGQLNAGSNVMAFGRRAAQSNIGGDAIAIGQDAAILNTADDVIAMGLNAAGENAGNAIIAIGDNAAANNTGADVTAVGTGAATANTGTGVTAVGKNAAGNNTAGSVTAFGVDAAFANTAQGVLAIGQSAAIYNTGEDVTAVGSLAGFQNTGETLIAFGPSAALYNTGSSVLAIGSSAAENNTGEGAIAIGNSAALSNEALQTLAIGNNAMRANSTGLANIGVGYQTLKLNSAGSFNTALGYRSGEGTDPGVAIPGVDQNSYSGNTLFGAYTGYALSTGSSNTIIGANTGMGLTSGTNNILIGASISPMSNTGSNQLNIGNAIFGNIGSGLGYANLIGINVASATTALEVSGTVSATRFVGDGSLLTGIGGGTPDRIVSGTTGMYAYNNTSATIVTAGVERLIVGSNGKVAIGQQPGGFYDLAISGTLVTRGAANAIFVADRQNIISTSGIYRSNNMTSLWDNTAGGTDRLTINNTNGNVGIGTSTPSTTLQVSGTTTTDYLQLVGVSGSAGVSMSSGGGADNLGNHTATQNLDMAGFSIVNATGLNLDRISTTGVSSGSGLAMVMASTGSVSFTLAGTAGAAYIHPVLGFVGPGVSTTGPISGTVVTTPVLKLIGVAGGAGVSMSTSGDNLGNHTAVQALNMNTYSITGANNVSATGNIKTTAALQAGNTDTTCSTSADYGKIRFDQATKRAFLCRP